MLKSLLLTCTVISTAAFAAEPVVFTVKTMTAQMKYDTTELLVAPGTPVTLHFENGDDLPHNFCLCDRGTDVVALAMKQMEKPEEALQRNWLPDDKRIWAHSKLLNPKEKDTLTFTAPTALGDYPFVCTFPGHAMTMRGTLNVVAKGEIVKDLKFALYLGNWKKLPDFSALKPHREGSVADNLVQIKVDDYKNEFGVVFTGKLNVAKDGNHTFYLSSDDGGRILIDGKQVVEYDGIHPAGELKEGMVKLAKGEHEFRLEYFQAAGNIELYAAWKGPQFSTTWLSKTAHPSWKGGKKKKVDETTGMPLVVKDEAIVYRNFIATAGNRSIGVGYPGGFNIAWNAETMNLVLLWRGAFIDAARHWNSRGGGPQPPLGYDILRPAGMATLPLATMSSPSADWPKLEPLERATGYQFKGYHLDKQRLPTFNYEWNGVQVSDRFDPHGSGITADGKLVRTLTLKGKVPENSWLRIATGPKIEAKDGAFIVDAGRINIDSHNFDNKCRITAEGASLEGSNLVVPVKAGSIKVTYQWLQ